MKTNAVRFIHLSDTHIGPERDSQLRGICPFERAEALIERLRELPFRPDFVLHTGDIVSDPDPAAYQLTDEIFQSLDLPMYYVAGNHDSAADIRQYLRTGPLEYFPGAESALDYRYDSGVIEMLCLDGAASAQTEYMGRLSEPQYDILKETLENLTKPLVIGIHFSALPLDCGWLDSQTLLEEGGRFHKMLVPYADRIRGVFFGHVHRGMQIVRDGIFYCSVASNSFNFRNYPTDERAVLVNKGPLFFNIVTLTADTVLVKQYMVGEE